MSIPRPDISEGRSVRACRWRTRQSGYADREEAETAGKALVGADRDGAGTGYTLEQGLTTKDALWPSPKQGYAATSSPAWDGSGCTS
ncbi:hypothetical protein [Nonomuraea sp. KM90]|uniref:hypothetical protein n=1 Tax=Nonomuraea sp. KM90 TaxID=3457428 RepID=UPI003FCE04F4